MYLALKRANVPTELHVYAHGGHGFGVRKSSLACSTWTDRCVAWLQNQACSARTPKPVSNFDLQARISDKLHLHAQISGANRLARTPGSRFCFGSHAPYFYFESAKLKLQESALSEAQMKATCTVNTLTHLRAPRYGVASPLEKPKRSEGSFGDHARYAGNPKLEIRIDWRRFFFGLRASFGFRHSTFGFSSRVTAITQRKSFADLLRGRRCGAAVVSSHDNDRHRERQVCLKSVRRTFSRLHAAADGTRLWP